MPQPRVPTKLTLRLPREDLDFLERYAAAHGLSVMEVISRHLSELRDREGATVGVASGPANREDPDQTRAQFEKLAQDWHQATRFVSSLTDMIAHPAYQRIIGMGFAVVPLILERLRLEPDHWFWALKSITGEDPVPAEARGDVTAMGAAWLAWGRRQGYGSVG